MLDFHGNKFPGRVEDMSGVEYRASDGGISKLTGRYGPTTTALIEIIGCQSIYTGTSASHIGHNSTRARRRTPLYVRPYCGQRKFGMLHLSRGERP